MFGGINSSGRSSSKARVLHLPTMVSHLCSLLDMKVPEVPKWEVEHQLLLDEYQPH